MNLHQIVTPLINAVNPFVLFTISQSTGYITNADGSRTPTYSSFTAMGQMQAASGGDLRQVESLNLNGTFRSIYFNGEIDAIVRAVNKGGSLIIDPAGNIWLAHIVFEQWPDWCKIGVVLQNNS